MTTEKAKVILLSIIIKKEGDSLVVLRFRLRRCLVPSVLISDEKTHKKSFHELFLLDHLEDALNGGHQGEHTEAGDEEKG